MRRLVILLVFSSVIGTFVFDIYWEMLMSQLISFLGIVSDHLHVIWQSLRSSYEDEVLVLRYMLVFVTSCLMFLVTKKIKSKLCKTKSYRHLAILVLVLVLVRLWKRIWPWCNSVLNMVHKNIYNIIDHWLSVGAAVCWTWDMSADTSLEPWKVTITDERKNHGPIMAKSDEVAWRCST